MEIDSSKVKGEPGTGYEAPKDLGPFECENCHYFRSTNSTCGQETMVKVSKLERIGSRVKVDKNGCCEYVDRKGSRLINA